MSQPKHRGGRGQKSQAPPGRTPPLRYNAVRIVASEPGFCSRGSPTVAGSGPLLPPHGPRLRYNAVQIVVSGPACCRAVLHRNNAPPTCVILAAGTRRHGPPHLFRKSAGRVLRNDGGAWSAVKDLPSCQAFTFFAAHTSRHQVAKPRFYEKMLHATPPDARRLPRPPAWKPVGFVGRRGAQLASRFPLAGFFCPSHPLTFPRGEPGDRGTGGTGRSLASSHGPPAIVARGRRFSAAGTVRRRQFRGGFPIVARPARLYCVISWRLRGGNRGVAHSAGASILGGGRALLRLGSVWRPRLRIFGLPRPSSAVFVALAYAGQPKNALSFPRSQRWCVSEGLGARPWSRPGRPGGPFWPFPEAGKGNPSPP